jgi:hypothetical protein
MPAITLLERAYTDVQLKSFGESVKSSFQNLRVEVEVLGITSRKWVQISISGEDQNVALRYLTDRMGLCPESLENIRKFSVAKGRVSSRDNDKLCVDIGVFSPNVVDAEVPLQLLQAQLADGKTTPLERIVELYGLCPSTPLTVRLVDVDKLSSHVEAELSEGQLGQYLKWTRSLLDRLIILGASLERVELVVERAGLDRDVVGIEPLGAFEHAVVCKLGTDAAGLIPKIGKNLRNAAFSIFSPRRLLRFFDYEYPFSFSGDQKKAR